MVHTSNDTKRKRNTNGRIQGFENGRIEFVVVNSQANECINRNKILPLIERMYSKIFIDEANYDHHIRF